MAGVELGSDGRPLDVKTPLLVVRDADQHPDGDLLVCRICTARGERTVFYSDEAVAFARHVESCYSRNEDRLRSKSLRVKAPELFDPDQSGNVELRRWISKHRGAILEGRKRI